MPGKGSGRLPDCNLGKEGQTGKTGEEETRPDYKKRPNSERRKRREMEWGD